MIFMELSQKIAFRTIIPAVKRARLPILTVALTYILTVLIGILMVHFHVQFALDYRDKVVNQAYNGSNSTMNALLSGNRLQAALSDFAGNLFLGGVPDTASGLEYQKLRCGMWLLSTAWLSPCFWWRPCGNF
jgi:hypothetical protein